MAEPETKNCQNCKQDFIIEAEDFDFYSRIEVPAPTFCPNCRVIRRMMTRNERTLYKRKCMAPGHDEQLVTMYHPDAKVNIVDRNYWWGDEWDPMEYGKDYDFTRPFFEQYQELSETIPMSALTNSNAVNSDYCNVSDQSKDSYLSSGSFKIERTNYSNRVYHTIDCSDVYIGFRCELGYELISCNDCYRVFYSQDCNSCTDSYFLYDCRGCTNCFGCTNLRNKNYCIFNKQYSKEEYEAKMKEMNLDSFESLEKIKKQFEELKLKSLHRFARIFKSVNCTGNNIENGKNCKFGFDITEGAEDCKYINWGGLKSFDGMDLGPGFGDGVELAYEITDTGIQASNLAFTNVAYSCHNVRYCFYCHGGAYLFGCIGLRNKKYCILNKQYSKEEYEEMIPKIISHMNEQPYIDKYGKSYKYGEFFPEAISPFAYNETNAQDYFPLTKEAATEKGYLWRDSEKSTHDATFKGQDLPDSIKEVSEDILKETIECAHKGECAHQCNGVFRIVPQELQFYKNLGLPLPRLCFNCRHNERLDKRTPMRLWTRQCMCDYKTYSNSTKHDHHPEGQCQNKFETSYSPERPEIVYCEQCYQNEVS